MIKPLSHQHHRRSQSEIPGQGSASGTQNFPTAHSSSPYAASVVNKDMDTIPGLNLHSMADAGNDDCGVSSDIHSDRDGANTIVRTLCDSESEWTSAGLSECNYHPHLEPLVEAESPLSLKIDDYGGPILRVEENTLLTPIRSVSSSLIQNTVDDNITPKQKNKEDLEEKDAKDNTDIQDYFNEHRRISNDTSLNNFNNLNLGRSVTDPGTYSETNTEGKDQGLGLPKSNSASPHVPFSSSTPIGKRNKSEDRPDDSRNSDSMTPTSGLALRRSISYHDVSVYVNNEGACRPLIYPFSDTAYNIHPPYKHKQKIGFKPDGTSKQPLLPVKEKTTKVFHNKTPDNSELFFVCLKKLLQSTIERTLMSSSK